MQTTKRSKMRLPSRIEVHDYHEFDELAENLKPLGIKVKEIRSGPQKRNPGGYNVYHGILYKGRLNDPKVKKLIETIDREIHDAVCVECEGISQIRRCGLM